MTHVKESIIDWNTNTKNKVLMFYAQLLDREKKSILRENIKDIKFAKSKGYTVDPKEIDDKVATGPKRPSKGKTNKYILGTNKKQNAHIQVYNMDNKRYELNMYIS